MLDEVRRAHKRRALIDDANPKDQRGFKRTFALPHEDGQPPKILD